MLRGAAHRSYLPQVRPIHESKLSAVVGSRCHLRLLFVLVVPLVYRFGSFEIFKRADEFTGRQGPSYGRDEIRAQMMDYVIEMFYPEIQRANSNRVERNVAFFREVTTKLIVKAAH